MMHAPRVHLAQRRPYQDMPAKLFVRQCVIAAVLVGLAWVLVGRGAALSTLLGSVVSMVPALYFACRFLRPHGSRQAKQHVSNLYRAQAGKFILTMALFIIVFVKLPPAHPVLFFSAYAVTCLVPQPFCWRTKARVAP